MRLRAILFALVVLALVGAGAWRVGTEAALWFERRTGDEIAAALKGAGETWAGVATDGLLVTLSGAAPDETSRFRALEIVRRSVNEARIADVTTLQAVRPLAPPSYALELLRNEAEVSLIGLVPETGGRDVIRAALGAGGLDGQVTDLLDSASDPAPDGWQPALGFGLSLIAQLPRAKVSVAPGKVAVSAIADTDADKAALEARLTRSAPAGVVLTLDVSAPRPVIAPFVFDFTLDGGTGVLAACSAESAEAAETILAAVRAAGLPGDGGDCPVGLGAPSPDWARAVTRGLGAVQALGGGRFTLRDFAAELRPPADAEAEKLVAVSAGLDQALPEGFALQTVVPAPPQDATAPVPPRFEAALAEGGAVTLAGKVGDPASRAAVLGYARALFGHERVTDAMEIGTGLPDGWPVRLLAGVQALAALEQGTLAVTPERLVLRGRSVEVEADARLEALLAEKLDPAAVEVDVAYDAAAAQAAEMAARPQPEICAEQIDAILAAGSIQFAAGSADIVPESAGVIAAIADVLRGCPGADFEIGGHTDAQGPAAANLRLSTARAEAVVAALRAQDLPLVTFTARGHGADVPVGDNATEAGRAMNRRIAFTLVDPDAPAAPVAEAGGAEAAGEAEAAQACTAEAARILEASQIEFEAGSATIAPASAGTVQALAGALAACPDGRFEIGGHTDAQGSEAGNERLSGRRAQAVVDALAAARPDLPPLVARGYGEADPVADNGTEAGRARNRRIAVATLDPDPEAPAVEAPLPALEGGDSPDATCAADVDAILAERPIDFEPGSATLAAASGPVIAEIAEALQACPDAAIEVGGHVGAEGAEGGDLHLGEQRADAVLAALRGRGLALPAFTARGYGAAQAAVAGEAAPAGDAPAAGRGITFTPVTAEQQDDEPDGPQ